LWCGLEELDILLNTRVFPRVTLEQSTMKLTFKTLLLSLASTTAAHAADLNLVIEPLAEAKGHVLIALYASEADYQKKPIRSMKVPAKIGALEVDLSDLPAGDYAVMLFHDLNDNNKLDANLFGLPTEPWGGSLGPRTLMGPPSWSDLKFGLPQEGRKITIRLN
jgi:uncharacterized protein (DUF2141 family)